MTNAEFAAITALVGRRAAIWTHEALVIRARDPDQQTPEHVIKEFKSDLMKALAQLP